MVDIKKTKLQTIVDKTVHRKPLKNEKNKSRKKPGERDIHRLVNNWCYIIVVAVIVWCLDLQVPMHSVPITIDVVSSHLDQDEVYNIMW